jgi:signal peptidase I
VTAVTAARGAAPAPRGGLLGSLAVAVGLALLARGVVAEPFAVPGGSMAPTLLEGEVVAVSRLAYGLALPFTGLTLIRFGSPRRGDVVVFRDPRDRSRLMARRVVGVAGDVVELREQLLFVGGVAQPRQATGEFSYAERDEATGGVRSDTCRRFREMLALGALAGDVADGPDGQAEAWTRGGAAGVVGHDLLQCRRPRAGRGEGPFGPVRRGHLFVLGDNRDRSSDGRDGGWQVPEEDVLGRVALVAWSWGPGGRWFGGASGPGVRIDRLLKPVE